MNSRSSLRDAVRSQTAAAHRALEATPLMCAVSAGDPSEVDYRDYLARQLAVHAPLEAALRPWLPARWRESRLEKSRWLQDDLRSLGASGAAMTATPAEISSEAEALGTLYVLEGATLGLQTVRRRIGTRRLGGSRFLLGYGEATGASWREFVAHLETLPRAAWPQAQEAAAETFAAFQRRFMAPRAQATP